MGKKGLIWSLAICILFMFSIGCAELTKSTKTEGAKAEGGKAGKVSPMYSEFKDVMIPPDMELDRNESLVYESHNLRMGVLYYSGRAELPEVVDFFKENMKNDGWELLNSFRHKTYILNFVKKGRNCIITVEKKGGKADIQIWMGPLQKKLESTKKKLRRR
ncbi:MAG: hypothetical protein JRI46_02920 [Deltaproteobacteria bacterium]|nr:hypothetical protein [Deltaproteobacteria bacterium]